MITDDDILRIKEALEGERYLIPNGLSEEQVVEFILSKVNTKTGPVHKIE